MHQTAILIYIFFGVREPKLQQQKTIKIYISPIRFIQCIRYCGEVHQTEYVYVYVFVSVCAYDCDSRKENKTT